MGLFRLFVVGACLASCICGCVTTSDQTASPNEITPPGEYCHEASGILFPKEIGEFQRFKVFQYDSQGRNISVGYNLVRFGPTIAATVYVRPIGDEDFTVCVEYAKAAVIDAHRDATVLVDEEFELSQPPKIMKGRHIRFLFTNSTPYGPQLFWSDAYLFTSGSWLFKYRITYLQDYGEKAQKDIQQLLQSLKL